MVLWCNYVAVLLFWLLSYFRILFYISRLEISVAGLWTTPGNILYIRFWTASKGQTRYYVYLYSTSVPRIKPLYVVMLSVQRELYKYASRYQEWSHGSTSCGHTICELTECEVEVVFVYFLGLICFTRIPIVCVWTSMTVRMTWGRWWYACRQWLHASPLRTRYVWHYVMYHIYMWDRIRERLISK